MADTVAIEKGIVDEVVARARATSAEVCGLLLGTPGRITGVAHCRNVAATPATSFEIDPAQLIAAHRHARSGGAALIGCYHSHPGGVPQPSRRDADDAGTDGWLWLIVADRSIACYRVRAGGRWQGRFESVRTITAGN